MTEGLEKRLEDEIAKKHGFKLEKDDPILTVFTVLTLFADFQIEKTQKFHDDILQQQNEFLQKWEASSKRIAETGLTEALKVRVSASQKQLDGCIATFEKAFSQHKTTLTSFCNNFIEKLSNEVQKLKTQQKHEKKFLGLQLGEVISIFLFLQISQLFLFCLLLWKFW